MPFQKGKSGNPSGRPKQAFGLAARAREFGPAALNRLLQLMASDNEAVALRAAEALLDRGFGKPTQAVELTGAEGGPIETVHHAPDPAEVAATLAVLAQARGAAVDREPGESLGAAPADGAAAGLPAAGRA